MLKELTECYLRLKEKRLKNPKVEDKELEEFLLDSMGKRIVCLRARQKKHTAVLPCWAECLDFLEGFKPNSPSHPFTQVGRKKVIHWHKMCRKHVNKP